MRRRELLLGGAAAGAMLALTPRSTFARSMLAAADGGAASRQSRLFPDDGLRLAHTDLHNHTLMSDGAGNPDDAFAQLRAAGLDVASLTDHAVFGSIIGDSTCPSCSSISGFDDVGWDRTKELADAANAPGQFVAIRGFEWTTTHLGHINVWFSEQWVDSISTGSLIDPDALTNYLGQEVADLESLARVLEPVIPPTSDIEGFYEWLQQPPTGDGWGGGGADALAGFNHPNFAGNFNDYQLFAEVVDRMVSVELLNGRDDYLYVGLDHGEESPVNGILNAGWRVGALGVTDEHAPTFDVAEGKGRAGMWVSSLTRDGVREALAARRFFATRLPGLRVDAAANGVRMGGDLPHRSGPVAIAVDVDRGAAWHGKRLLASVLVAGPAGGMPTIAHVQELTVPGPDQPVVTFPVELDADDSPWALLRLSDPEAPAPPIAPGPFATMGDTVAYASPWFLRPDLAGAGSASPAQVVAASAGAATSGAAASGPGVTPVDPATGRRLLPATGGGRRGLATAVAAAVAALAARYVARASDVGLGHAHAHGSEPSDHAHPHGPDDHPHSHPRA